MYLAGLSPNAHEVIANHLPFEQIQKRIGSWTSHFLSFVGRLKFQLHHLEFMYFLVVSFSVTTRMHSKS